MSHICIDIEDKKTLRNDNPFAMALFMAMLILDIVIIHNLIMLVVVGFISYAFSQFIVQGGRRESLLKFKSGLTSSILTPSIEDTEYVLIDGVKNINDLIKGE